MSLRAVIDLLDQVPPLPFEDKVFLAHNLGLQVACCDHCGCYIGAPYCHPADDAVISGCDPYNACLSDCPDSINSDDPEEKDRA